MLNYQVIEPYVDSANYLAIKVLEHLGFDAPTQDEIDIIESIFLLAIKPKRVDFKSFKAWLGNDTFARRILLRYLSNSKHKD